jgi:hypothetical protein
MPPQAMQALASTMRSQPIVLYGPQNGACYRLEFLDGKLVSIDFSR